MIDDRNVFSSSEIDMVSTRDKDDNSEDALVEEKKGIPLSEMDSTIDEEEVTSHSELFSDKNVPECDQPELIVCCQENSYVIKDICVDEGIPKDNISSSVNGNDKNEDIESRIEKKMDIQILISERENDRSCANEPCDDVNVEKNVLGKQKPTEVLPQSFESNGNADELEYNQVKISKEDSVSVSPAEDQLKSGFVSISSIIEKEKTFTVPDSHVKPPPIDDGNDKRPQKTDGDSRKHEEVDLDISNGESSSGPVSGLITYSGPISYVGSISIRSDSSTTSARSFAFPVLQSEWNSSPVRMAKAKGRRYTRHRRWWRNGLLCCRF